MRIKHLISTVLKPKGKTRFLRCLSDNCSLLDVGCGNDSHYWVKDILPFVSYTGVDIGYYNLTKPLVNTRYLLVGSSEFAEAIAKMSESFDAVISNHNLEHCEDPYGTLVAMAEALRSGGRLFIAFPASATLSFPSRKGSLNYRDDGTHKLPPPNYNKVLNLLKSNNVDIVFSVEQYRPSALYCIGFFLEPASRLLNRVLPGTWAYYGFESIIWGKKR
ncbi:class I SAM-dependent methyltransferase [Kordiimonas gwangyangensis]|uniref:class I SAM-dependent methyltransferase n=1 Tax=Kordiimonas gwangyangensis TaxID=288022 RepID=UPI0009DAB3F2